MGSASEDVQVREIAAADLAAVTDVYAQHVLHGTGTFELAPPTVQEMSERVAAVTAAALPFLVAEDGGRVTGFAYAGPYRSRPAYAHTVEDSIYLHPDASGRGVGTQLLQALLLRCEAWGARQVVAVIGDSANRASVRLHEKCGFALVGTLRSVGWKHDRWLDTVIMQRSLGRADTVPPGAR